MAQTIYASFADASMAEKAAGALLDYGVRQEDLSLVANDKYGRARVTEGRQIDPDAVNRTFRGNWGDYDSTMSAGDIPDAGYRGGVAAPDRPSTMNPDVYDPIDRSNLDTQDRDLENAAKHGLSTTTPADVGVGAVKGAGWGLGLGIIASVASLAVPGIGWVAGGGALAAALAGTVGTTIGGAIVGGVAGYLKDQGMPEPVAQDYGKNIENGGALLGVTVPSGKVDPATAEQILSKYGAANISPY
jgi:hypothetical protein